MKYSTQFSQLKYTFLFLIWQGHDCLETLERFIANQQVVQQCQWSYHANIDTVFNIQNPTQLKQNSIPKHVGLDSIL